MLRVNAGYFIQEGDFDTHLCFLRDATVQVAPSSVTLVLRNLFMARYLNLWECSWIAIESTNILDRPTLVSSQWKSVGEELVINIGVARCCHLILSN